MADYSGIQKEHQLKNFVFDDFFNRKGFSWEQEVGNIDFILTARETRGGDLFQTGAVHHLWAEAKKGTHDVYTMYTQLILTVKPTYEKGEHLAPSWLGCFDQARISFVPFNDILPVFNETDFNWDTTPSDHTGADFRKAREKVKALIGAKLVLFNFREDESEIKAFIHAHFVMGAGGNVKSPITEANFVQIYYKWIKEVRPAINMSKAEWADYKKAGVLECDFFRADIMSDNGNTITLSDKLKIILADDRYKLQDKTKFERLFYIDIGFKDEGDAYRRFWNRFDRPPAAVYQKYIIDRRDLLVPRNIRETKGSFFTPKIWADVSKSYLEAVFGANWQDEYYIWDCAAGTGNLLAGLANPYNVFASDIDQTNVDTMKAMADIDENLHLLDGHIFQFDFLNDVLTKKEYDWNAAVCAENRLPPPPERKLPKALCDIIDDAEKRKKLIIYVNPPYAESGGGIGTGINKPEVVMQHNSHDLFLGNLGKASHELFSQFMARVYYHIPQAQLALFSTLKYLNSYNFQRFRLSFRAAFKKGFMCKANTFDNVHGEFPIGFLIWELNNKEPFPTQITLDVYDADGTQEKTKTFYNGLKYINDWFRHINAGTTEEIAVLHAKGMDFQNNQGVWFCINQTRGGGSHFRVTEENLVETAVYFAVRHCVKHTWINHNDQFLYPAEKWQSDFDFQNNCLVYALMADKNRISVQDASCEKPPVNHWIPFTEKEVCAKEKFQSGFMSGFLKGKTLSPEAQAVLDAGRKLWTYYHKRITDDKTASVDASFYDIRAFFQGRNDTGVMHNASPDETYNRLIAVLREAQKTLAANIEAKIYEYGFLKE